MPILIERGSYYSHCGLAGNDSPNKSFNTPNISVKDQFRHIFYEILDVDPSKFSVVIVKDTFTPQEVLKEEADILFNTFNVRACAFVNAQVGVFFNWTTRGAESLVIDIGYKNTKIVPIIDVMPQIDSACIIDFAGKDIEQYIIDHLLQNGVEKDIIESNREELIPFLMGHYYYFEVDPEYDFEGKGIEKHKDELSKTYTFNDNQGKSITITLPNPILPEDLITGDRCSKNLIFSKEIIKNLATILGEFGEKFHSLIQCEGDPYTSWWIGKILLSGGGSFILGLRSLLIREILSSPEFKKHKDQHRNSHSPYVDIEFQEIVCTILSIPTESIYSTWIGASIASSLTCFQECMITKEKYNSHPNIEFLLDNNPVWKEMIKLK